MRTKSSTDRELGKLAVGAVVDTRVATHEGEGDSHDEGQARGDEVAHGGDLGRLGSHAPGLSRVIFSTVVDRIASGSKLEPQGGQTPGWLQTVLVLIMRRTTL